MHVCVHECIRIRYMYLCTHMQMTEVANRHSIIRKTEHEIENTLNEMAKLKKEESAKVCVAAKLCDKLGVWLCVCVCVCV